jgi:hypothetical protein
MCWYCIRSEKDYVIIHAICILKDLESLHTQLKTASGHLRPSEEGYQVCTALEIVPLSIDTMVDRNGYGLGVEAVT